MAPLAVRHEVEAPLFAPNSLWISANKISFQTFTFESPSKFQRKIKAAPGKAENCEKQIAELSRFLFYLFPFFSNNKWKA